ncbi:DUF3098 domain-containing protein [Aureibacter tunicatorum]|uniref:Membrane protein n=1 Tax=Aureibacter tunicatorum TaxID=866807 RepID=A0AAE3XR15_9BACT|nr:DUF3098 domain-containing protein [Aureibacter tunicatorum]MDR6239854.1 putative membrane protein [Aureibacter tunicatorum]BDD04329.1 hypothetical protein AUTU_18120 [Aureibacter tunicatorum]
MEKNKNLAFDKTNYIWMLIGIATFIIGLVIMTMDTEDYGFGFFGITLGPIVIIASFILQFYTIFKKSKK